MVIPSEITSKATALQHAIIDQYIKQYGYEDAPTVQKLTTILRAKRDTLIPLTNIENLRIAPGTRIRSSELNTLYASVDSDVYMLFAAAGGIGQLLEKYKVLTDEKYNRIEGKLRQQEGRLSVLKHLKDNPTHREAWSINLQNNTAVSYDSMLPVFNAEEQALSLPAVKSDLVSAKAIKTIRFYGDYSLYSSPGYGIENIDDRSKQNAWYTIATYKSRPLYMADLSKQHIEAVQADTVRMLLPAGTTSISTTSTYFSVGDYITVGEPYDNTTEVVKISARTATTITLESGLVNAHYTGEPIYIGKSLQQLTGAVVSIDNKYTYPQSINLIRIYPFSARAVKVLGVFNKVNGVWEKIPGSDIGFIDKQATITFDTVIGTEFRLLLQQPHGVLNQLVISKEYETNEEVWNTLYAKEYNVGLSTVTDKLDNYSADEIVKATSEDKLEQLLKRDSIAALQKVFIKKATSTTDEMGQDMSMFQKYVSADASKNITIIRYTYEMGLAELEFYNNSFQATADYLSTEITPKMNFDACYLEVVEDLNDYTSTAHSILTGDGYDLAIPNSLHRDVYGAIESRNELVEIDHTTKKGKLRFVPLDTQVTVKRVYPLNEVALFTLPVTNLMYVDLSNSNIYHQKGVYQCSYRIKEPIIDVVSSLVSKPYRFSATATTDGSYLELPKAPVIEYGIVNDEVNWRKRPNRAIWDMVMGNVPVWVTTNKSFPTIGKVFNNIYYGPACPDAISRNSILEAYLLEMFSKYSATPDVLVSRFFNKYEGQTLPFNMSYSPIKVSIDGKELLNLSNYNGMPDAGFLPSAGTKTQCRHFETRILFPEPISDSNILVEYQIRETSLQYKGTLNCNSNSEFTSSPLLRNVVLATE